jgi:hypothetical protein
VIFHILRDSKMCLGTALAEGHDSWLGVDAKFVVDSSTASRFPFTAARRYSTGCCTSVQNILLLHRKKSDFISVLWVQIQIRRIPMFLDLQDPDTSLFVRILPSLAEIVEFDLLMAIKNRLEGH